MHRVSLPPIWLLVGNPFYLYGVFELLKNNISRQVQLTGQEFERIAAAAHVHSFKKRALLLQAGKIDTNLFFVSTGCLRSFSVDEQGREHTSQFAFEDYWISDLYSYVTQKPASLSIEALEDSEVIVFKKEAFDLLLDEVPKLERHIRLLLQNAYIATQERLNCTMSEPADKRYEVLLQKFPQIIQRVPLLHIASFLGITPESLSRIRKAMAAR